METENHALPISCVVELRGFEPMAIAGAVRSRAIPPFAGFNGERQKLWGDGE